MYDQGLSRIEKRLDVAKILKDLAQSTVFLKSMFISKTIKKQLRHSAKNIINLDVEKEEEE